MPEENSEHLTKVEDSNITTIIITIVIIIKVMRERREEESVHCRDEDEEDTLSLGAEAVLHIVDNHPDEQSRPSRTSATSLISSCCSRESFLQSREPDPEQVCSPH